MRLTRTAIGLLTAQYRSVLKKCFLINVGLYALLAPAASLTTATAVAVTAMPKTAEASIVDNIMGMLKTGNESWSHSGSSEQEVTFNESTKTATGTVGIVDGGGVISYFTYNYTMPSNYTSQSRLTTLTSDNAINKYFYNLSTGQYAVAIYIGATSNNYNISSDFIKNGTSSTEGTVRVGSWTGNISGNFIGNKTSVEGSAIHISASNVNSVTGDFIGNYTQSYDGPVVLDGSSTVGTIKGNFVANKAVRNGAIDNEPGSKITTVLGNFVGNVLTNTITQVTTHSGSAINNAGTITNIGSETDKVNFYSNTITVDGSHEGYGGALYNTRKIDNIYADFVNNSISAANAHGGAIYSDNSIGVIGSAVDHAHFINNYVANNSNSNGGAIASAGSIDNIYADFIGNSAGHFGGAFYGNASSIEGNFIKNTAGGSGGAIMAWADTAVGKIKGSFIGNTATGGSGGAIYNYNGHTTSLDANFINNSTREFGGALYNPYGTIDIIKGNYVGNSAGKSGGALVHSERDGNKIGSINADFIGNSVTATSTSAAGGAVINQGKINSLTGNFIGNSSSSTDETSHGGAIYNGEDGSISNITGDFIRNTSTAHKSTGEGGAIYNGAGGSIGNIKGNFIGNIQTTESEEPETPTSSVWASGGAISNEGTTVKQASIANISGNFIGNKSLSSTQNTEGGALYSSGNIKITDTTFINNQTKTTAAGKKALGGAISMGGDYTISKLDADFIGNEASSTTGESLGGAIRNGSTITSLTGDFINNSVTSTSGAAYGGAIYNTGTINKIVGNFIGNKLTVGEGIARGAVIANEGNDANVTLVGSIIANNALIKTGAVHTANPYGMIYNQGTATLTDVSFYYNSTARDATSIRNGEYVGGGNSPGTIYINSVDKDVLFYGNKSNADGYADIANCYGSNLYLNANKGRDIVINGSIWGGTYASNTNGTIHINSSSSNKGGEYVFNSLVGYYGDSSNSNDFKLYNGANVRFGNVRQPDGTVTYGMYNGLATTNDANGAYMNFANNNTTGWQYLGDLTLNGDLKVGIDVNALSSIDGIDATSVTANGHQVLIDYINLFDNSDEKREAKANEYNIIAALTSNLRPIVDISDAIHINTTYEWDRYTADYDTSGTLTLTRNTTGATENLAGFLTQNATGTSYDMSRDEQMLVDLGAMAGENNAKTVNANGHNIIGNQHAGVTLAAGQTLTINDANVEGFYKEGNTNNGIAIYAYDGGILNVNNSVFRNNSSTGGAFGGALMVSGGSIIDSSFYNNGGTIDQGGAVYAAGGEQIIARTKDSIFEGNTSSINGGGAQVSEGVIRGENGHKVIFSNNSSTSGGGVSAYWGSLTVDNAEFLYNNATSNGGALWGVEGAKNISNTLFKGNSASYGGAIYNSPDMVTNISNSTFENNTATKLGGAIYNSGTIGEFDANNKPVDGTGIINTTFRGNYITTTDIETVGGGAIYNGGQISNITGEFIGNMITTELGSINGGTIYNENKIGTIDADFIGNVTRSDSGYVTYGGVINNGGTIDTIKGLFKDNLAMTDTKHVQGGVISNGGIINNILADFINNKVVANNSTGQTGSTIGALFLSGHVGKIGDDTHKVLFKNNSITENKNTTGGAAVFAYFNSIDSINADFIGNKIITSGSNASGAAVNVVGSQIGSIKGDFLDNSIIDTENGNVEGVAINVTSGGNITSIGTSDNHSKFEGNYVQANTGSAYGGAIYNAGTIDNIYADFTGNEANTVDGSQARGGAIYNAGTIRNLTGIFTNNKAFKSGGDGYAQGGAIDNSGNIKITDSTFIGSTADYTIGTSIGGAIINSGNAYIKGVNNSVLFKNNKVTGNGYGGTIYNQGGKMHVENASFIGNSAATAGGGFETTSSTGTTYLKNVFFGDNRASYAGALYTTYGGKLVAEDSSFKGNYADIEGGAIRVGGYGESGFSGATVDLVANEKDVYFRDNKVDSNYSDVFSQGTLNLNAASGKSIDFGGSVTGKNNAILNINQSNLVYDDLKDDGTFETETKDITQTGGKYIFRGEVSGQTMNLYNGANVKYGDLLQTDGTSTYGHGTLTGFTSTGTGNILDAINGSTQYKNRGDWANISLGAVTLNANTNLRLNAWTGGTGGVTDYFEATSYSGSGKFLIDQIYVSNASQASSFTTNAVVADALIAHTAMAPTYHTIDGIYKDAYNVTYNSNGTLTFNRKSGPLEYSLKGFLNTDTSNTVYNMTFDEIASNIGVMVPAGTTESPVTKTVNAGNFTIDGSQGAGVQVGGNQTLNINGGIWDGFNTSTSGAVISAEDNSKVSLNNVVMQNNNVGVHGVIATSGDVESVTGIFKNNTGGSSGVLTGWNAKNANFKSIRAEFSNNTTSGAGTVISVGKQNKANIYGGSSFNYNSAGNRGGAILDSGASVKIDADNNDIIFSNNTAVAYGGAIAVENEGTLDISATGGDVIFDGNTAGMQGGAIYNTGTLSISGTNTHRVKFENNATNYTGRDTFNQGGVGIYNTGSITSLDADFINNTATSDNAYAMGGAVLNYGEATTVTTIKGNYENNSAVGKESRGGAIAVWNHPVITTIDATFKNNASIASSSGSAGGGALWVEAGDAKVETVNGKFESNFTQGIQANGGAIFVDNASITNLNGTFDNNNAQGLARWARGGAIGIGQVNSVISSIGTIGSASNKSTFTNNYAQTGGTNAYGGAISNYQNKIGGINADFTGNYAKSTGEYKVGAGGMVISKDTDDNQGSGRAYGGAIFNLASLDDEGAVVENTGVIDSITGNFKDNYVYSENGYALGGAIYNEYGTIDSIGSATNKALFQGNKTESEGRDSRGGAINNIRGTITNIYADFINNTSISAEGSAGSTQGGAIDNNGGVIGSIVGDFTGNTITAGTYAIGAAIHNEIGSTIGTIQGNFTNNIAHALGHDATGAIRAKSIITSIVGDFIANGAISDVRDANAGAINVTGNIELVKGNFTNNYAKSGTGNAYGGAINLSPYQTMGSIETLGAEDISYLFSGNYAQSTGWAAYGGAIRNEGTIGTLDTETGKLLADNTGIINTSFTDNYVTSTAGDEYALGGAIYNSGAINLTATLVDEYGIGVKFANNKANGRYNDVYNSGTLNLNAASNSNINFGGSIEGSGAININTGATSGGTYVFKSDVSAGNVTVGSAASNYAPASLSFEKATQEDGSTTNGTFDVDSLTINGDGNSLSTRNDKVDTNSATTLTLNNALNMQIDGDLQSGTGDSITGITTLSAPTRSLRLTSMNFTADPDVTTLSKDDTIDVDISGGESTLDGIYTLASTNPDDTTEEQIEQAYLDSLTSSSGKYKDTYQFRSAKLMTKSGGGTYVQYGDNITLKWLYENYISGWSGGNYILKNVADGGSAVSGETLTVGGALMALDSALGKNDTYNFSSQSVADVLVNNYYTKLVKKGENSDKNKGNMNVKSLKKGTNSSKRRIIKGISAFPSIMCTYPFDMPHVANDNIVTNDNDKNVILGACDSKNPRISANDNDSAEILRSSRRMTNYFNKQAA